LNREINAKCACSVAQIAAGSAKSAWAQKRAHPTLIKNRMTIFLRKPQPTDAHELLAAYERSVSLHAPWTSSPNDIEQHIQQDGRYLVCRRENGAIVGTFHISGIIRGAFQSAYLGYAAFEPHAGKGYIRIGLKLLLDEAFGSLNLHRLEANIQPENLRSIDLVSRAGFVKEGFSRQYLRVGQGEWMDHERWAILNPNWRENSV
jgi:[ribosomal protein S5]-alanine N-acetyltransferase